MPRSNEWMRLLDRSLLAQTVRGLNLLNRHRGLPEAPERIGVIQPTAIGDTLLSSGVVSAIAARYPYARLRIFHGANNGAAVRMLAACPEPVPTDFSRPDLALRALRAANLDLVIDLTPWPNLTAILARLSAPCAVGFAPPGKVRGKIFDIAIPHQGDRHELDNLAAMAQVFGTGDGYRMRLKVDECSVAAALPLDRLVICHLTAGGSRAEEKAWPMEYWAILCTDLIDAGYVPAFTGSPVDRKVIDQLQARLGNLADSTLNLCGKVPFTELGDLLRRAYAVVSIDTSVLHLAGAVDARIIGLHGPTRSWRWGARSPYGIGIDSPHPDAGYIVYGAEVHPQGMEIMRALTPDMVLPVLLGMEERLNNAVA